MKFSMIVILLVLSPLFFLVNCTTEKKSEVKMENEMKSEKAIDITADMLTTSIDLVCGMDLTTHPIKDTTIYKDQLYGFCSEYCKQKFLENPEEMIAKLEQDKPENN
jgi:YHS domain-containing protein